MNSTDSRVGWEIPYWRWILPIVRQNKWQEFYFNGTPFYSVLPDRDRFPCYTGMAPDPPLVEDDGPRSPSMCAAGIRADLAEITDTAAPLVERRLDYETLLTDLPLAAGFPRRRPGDGVERRRRTGALCCRRDGETAGLG